jgi:hypothetical protein
VAREPKPTFDPEHIRDISEKVYRLRLEHDSPGNVARMIEKDKDGGRKLRNRASYYDAITRDYLEVLGFEPSPMSQESGSPMSKAIGVVIAAAFGLLVGAGILYMVGESIDTFAQYQEERDHAQ